MKQVLMIAFGLSLAACAGSQGTEPQDMSVAEHERAAGGEELQSSAHGGQYDPNAQRTIERCAKQICWTSEANPTEQHKQDMQAHRELAEKHRAAAGALRTAEAQSCVGIPEDDRDVSPFYHREDIAAVGPVERTDQRGDPAATYGGRAVFRAVPGLTAEWLQREVDCHRARAAAVGFDMQDMSYCPLMLKGVTAKVTSTGDGFAVEVTSTDPKTGEEILRRMQGKAQG